MGAGQSPSLQADLFCECPCCSVMALTELALQKLACQSVMVQHRNHVCDGLCQELSLQADNTMETEMMYK